MLLKNMQIAAIFLNASPGFSLLKDESGSYISETEYNSKLKQVKEEKKLFQEIFQYCQDNNLCKTISINVQADAYTYRNIDDVITDIEVELAKKEINL